MIVNHKEKHRLHTETLKQNVYQPTFFKMDSFSLHNLTIGNKYSWMRDNYCESLNVVPFTFLGSILST